MELKHILRTRKYLILLLLGFLVFIGVFLYFVDPATWTLRSFANTQNDGDISVNPSVGNFDLAPSYNSGKVGNIKSPNPSPEASGGATSEKDQKLIKTGSLTITVNDFDSTVESIRKIAKDNKGLISSSSDSGEKNLRNATITVRVPADKFDEVMSLIKKLGVDVISSSENSSDVTQVYMDLEARLKTSKALEESLKGILNKAQKVSEIIEIQRELSSVQQTIEYLESQIRYYDSQIDMSTIVVSLKLNTESLDVNGDIWKPLGVFKEASQALVLVLKGLVSVLIWMIIFSPFVLVPYGIYKLVTRKKGKGV